MNRDLRNRTVLENMPLVGYLVSDVCSKADHLSRDDLASAGALALISAAEAFDPAHGVPFGAFARRRILGAFADEMRANDWVSRSARRRIHSTSAVRETLTASLGRTPTTEEVAEALGVERSDVEARLQEETRTLTVLDASADDLPSADTASPEDTVVALERDRYVRSAVQSLPEKMRYIVEQVYFADRPVTEIAAELGISHSAVSQQRSEAMRLMHDGLSVHYVTPGAAHAPKSRVSGERREAYLSTVGARTAGGYTRIGQPVPALVGAA